MNTSLTLRVAGWLLLLWPTLAFSVLAFVVRGAASLRTARAAASEVRTNIALYALDLFVTTPLLALTTAFLAGLTQAAGISLLAPSFWSSAPPWAVAFLCVFIGDFIGYWRHRLEHTAILWPAHAIHHSDTTMTWTTLYRFHPINRFSTALIETPIARAVSAWLSP